MNESKFEYLGSTITTAKMNPVEENMFNAQYDNALVTVDADERRILQDRKLFVKNFVEAMKDHFKAAFGGYQAADTEVGMSFIRPGHVGFTATRTWAVTIASSTAYQDWVASSGSPLSTGGTDGDAGLVAFYLKSFATAPKISEILVKGVGRNEFIPTDVRSIALGDNTNQVPIIPIPTLMSLPKESLHIRIKGDTVGDDIVALGGFMVGLGRYLKKETY